MTLQRAGLLALALGVSLAVAGCGSAKDPSPQVIDDSGLLPDRVFVVTGVTDQGKPHSTVDGTQIRITLSASNLRLTAGCNTMSGTYQLDGTRLTVGSLATTEMGCAKRLMDQDAWLAGLFEKPAQLTTGKDAALIAGNVVLNLAPRETVHPDKPLAGTRWVLDGLFDDQTASSATGGRLEVTGTSVRLFNGCRSLTATGKVAGSTITWGPGRMTLDYCSDEGALLDSIGKSSTYEITENTLTITTGHRGLTFRSAG